MRNWRRARVQAAAEIADWAISSCSAAAVMLPDSADATKYRSWTRVKPGCSDTPYRFPR